MEMVQRALLPRAIVNEPELLILDEPVSSIDSETRQEFFGHIVAENKGKQDVFSRNRVWKKQKKNIRAEKNTGEPHRAVSDKIER